MKKHIALRAALNFFAALSIISWSAVWVQAAELYHGNTTSRIYHNAKCKYFNCKKCTVVFKTSTDAQKAGYRPCKVCKG